jgi:CHAT domain-containing protein
MNSGLLVSDGKELPSRKRFEETSDCDAATILTAMEIIASDGICQHVTLQACSLGRSHIAAGDEMWGVMRALIAGGANSVVAPLWDIDIPSSTELARSFYRKWLYELKPAPIAMAEAQYSLSKNVDFPEWSHFYHWGGLLYTGL